ncbi:MAG TPA: AAA family ATPase [Isosphaeraceae bacterium]|nr:AAA family ATPase [Isosphaeraceae bacterium]
MELEALIESLSKPEAYPHPLGEVEVRQTHISVVFLAGEFAYKVKKPLALGFLDYSTLEKRRHFCEQEVRLNRRLAGEVYLGVVPIARQEGDALRVEGEGEVLEWAVKMARLPEGATLRERLERGEVGIEFIEELARRVAAFHASAERGEHISSFGRFEVVAANARENFEQSAAQVGVSVSQSAFERLRELTEKTLVELNALIESRAAGEVPRDTHGDLRLDHVYLFPDRVPPAGIAIVDCIEFNERYRFADPVADMAFLFMDLALHGRRDLARAFAGAYFAASNDAEGRRLLPFYEAYRAVVRGKVEGIRATEAEVAEVDRETSLRTARACWLVALGALEEPGRRPCLALVGGLQGTGKSTLAKGLATKAGFVLIRSDVVRKELAGSQESGSAASAFGEGIYTSDWNRRTYAECLRRAESEWLEGRRVVVDATFRFDADRRLFLETASRCGVPALVFLCKPEPGIVRARLEQRRGDASDADWSIFERTAEQWEQPGAVTRAAAVDIDTSHNSDETLAQALRELRERELLT